MEFRILDKTEGGSYFSGPHNCEYLMTLSYVFTDGIGFAKNIIKDLLDTQSQGRYGNITDVYIEGSIVKIHHMYGFDSDTEPIEIDRNELLRIMKDGLFFMEKQVPYIVLQRENQNAPIIITDVVPEGMQLEFKNKRLYAHYKGETF
ncbi:hypothetical protein Noda2021_09580 [Candidatus Dependentiae bacterium Noda2021]|nr:hypothetical protein Noda2021_09580 [Candidatus Dependentiae bacterium Noda2021]